METLGQRAINVAQLRPKNQSRGGKSNIIPALYAHIVVSACIRIYKKKRKNKTNRPGAPFFLPHNIKKCRKSPNAIKND
jgi:hypothetical protein